MDSCVYVRVHIANERALELLIRWSTVRSRLRIEPPRGVLSASDFSRAVSVKALLGQEPDADGSFRVRCFSSGNVMRRPYKVATPRVSHRIAPRTHEALETLDDEAGM
jgi:hypothetical protein